MEEPLARLYSLRLLSLPHRVKVATPVICGGRIYHRVAHDVDGERRETLYCLGEK